MKKPKEEPKHPKVFSENGNELFFDEQGNMIKEEPKQEDEYIGECKGNDGNGCFMDSCGHNCGCFKKKPKQETLEEVVFKVPFDYHIKPKEVMDMCMKEQQNIILTWRLGYFIDMINSLPDDIEKNRILKSVFDNRDGELLLESYKSMKSHYEK